MELLIIEKTLCIGCMELIETEGFYSLPNQPSIRLLHLCFPGYPHIKLIQVPATFLNLLWEGKELIGHMGVVPADWASGDLFPVFALSTFCILPLTNIKNWPILLSELEELAKSLALISYLIAKEQELYLNIIFKLLILFKWLC
ncbi:hypothetical protein D5R40_28645 [Okeania hirsuta]|uniref:Uncharacterized protein n=1 Tax=Okeania hirsuta TaxID=1458930 RepID=A0A3N6P3I9_9CYAN|nr:hypothetical protein D5R40_28645 [Okeania hirsuta]